MLTLYDVPWKRNILRVCERSRHVDLRSRRAKRLVLRLVSLAHRIREDRAREVRHVHG